MKNSIINFIHSKGSKRLMSALTAVVVLISIMPIREVQDELSDSNGLFNNNLMHAFADEEPRYPHEEGGNTVRVDVEKLVDYSDDCVAFREYHSVDNLIITTGGDTTVLSAGFKGLGDSNYPFSGTVTVEQTGGVTPTLNLDAPLFNYVYDDVTLNNGSYPLLLSREYGENKTETTPILADVVRHKNSGGATWDVSIVRPSDDNGTGNPIYNLDTFGGLIGTMEYNPSQDASEEDKGANLTLSVTMNRDGSDIAAASIKGTSNLGFVCGEMQAKTTLNFTLVSDRGVGEISTTNGNVGGLIGSMASESSFSYTGVNPQTVTAGSKNIKTDKGYAGGVVGKNSSGAVTLATSPYPIGQIIKGTNGTGGVYGYYQPGGTADITIDTTNYLISGTFNGNSYNCQVNGAGNAGGLIGELDCTNNITITGSQAVTTSHAVTKAACYGGLIGKYRNDADHSLTVGSLSVTTANAGGATCYGGCLGKVDTDAASYVVFNAPTVSSSEAGTLTYGGLVALADNAFIDVNGATVTASDFKGGGLVGSLDHGVLRMNGAIDLSGATPTTPASGEEKKIGKIVGWRDDALVFATNTCELTKPDADFDDIGAWGQVITFNDYTVSQQKVDSETGEPVVNAETGEPVMEDVSVSPKIAQSDLFSISGHNIQIKAPSDTDYPYTVIASEADYAKTALCFQIDASKNPFVSFEETSKDYSTILEEDISLTANVDLTNTGFVGLTRDNDIGTDGIKCSYSGSFGAKTTAAVHNDETNEDEEVDTLHSITYGGETVYRHAYNSLFGIADGATITDAIFDGTISVKAMDTMYVGSAAATAKGDFTAKGLKINTTLNHDGASDLTVGGALGAALSGIEKIEVGGSEVADKITANATITGGASGNVYLGGVIGKISHTQNESTDWKFTNVNVTGSISNTASLEKNQVGGLVAAISGFNGATNRSLELSKIYVDDFDISINAAANGSVGGLLGYSWLSVDTDFDDVQIDKTTQGSSITNSSSNTGIDFAGLVYCGTGYWTVQNANDIKINTFTLSSANAQSCGMIVNKGWSGTSAIDSALYLELQTAGAYNLTKTADKTSFPASVTDFDELVAYTAYYTGSGISKGFGTVDNLYVTQNGQGIISIQTSNANGGLIMDGTNANGTYTPSTALGQQMNSHSRYYYNLYSLKDATTDAAGLMSWGAKWYAHDSIKTDVSHNTTWNSTIPSDGDYDMAGYSWYPLNIDSSSVSIGGTFKLYNREFELSEDYATDGHVKRTSLYDNGTTQHYLMHSALFNNVNGKLNVGTVTLRGSIPQINIEGNQYSGMLVLGTVKGSGATDTATAKVTTSNVILDGVYVYNFNISNDYAPLLINKTDDYSTLTINGVRVSADTSYKGNANLKDTAGNLRTATIGGAAYPKIATSLIGNVGKDKNSKNININFSDIRLDGRSVRLADTSALDSCYHSDLSLFTKATLLNRLSFDTGKGTYNFNSTDDWKVVTAASGETPAVYGHDADHCVTYGKEIGYTDAAAYENTQYPNLERWYLDTNNTGAYVDPKTANGTGSYAGTFDSSYLPYVATGYSSTAHEYQLEVNHAALTFDGCGTYNDPYIITAGKDLTAINNILNNANPGTVKIKLPLKADSEVNLDATWHDSTYKHEEFIYKAASGDYPAGYYKYVDGTNNDYAGNTGTIKDNYLKSEEVRTYVAGAYYKLSPASNDNTITLDPSVVDTTAANYGSTFRGLGYTEDSFAQFRGVIVGTGIENIVNKSGYPLIAISNGSVVKDINVIVDSTRTITQTEAKSFSANPAEANCYGSVFGSILGGDSIIDGVNVTFQNSTITLDGAKAQLIPVGGYVGVVEKGGVIFRGMEGESGISGIPSGVVSATTKNGEMTSETNMRWLYVNPIIGRVINGYAVNEASAYRPYENGTRIYHGSAHTDSTTGKEITSELVTEYWAMNNSTGVIGAVDSDTYNTTDYTLQPVTMRNGNKQYSIADIKSAWGEGTDNKRSLTYTATENEEEVTKYYLPDSNKLTLTSAYDVSVPNGEAFFIMSVIVNSGMGKNKLGYHQEYQVTRWAQYDSVSKSLLADSSAVTDYDSYAKNDHEDSSAATGRAGYLAKFYTTNDTYAVNIANQSTDLTLSTENGEYTLPDGFKGVGNMYDNDGDPETDSVADDSYLMKITNFDGNGATVSMNSSWYYYMDEVEAQVRNIDDSNKNDKSKGKFNLYDDIYYHHKDVGFGLFNYQNGSTTGGESSRYFNIILTGNVVSDCIDSNSSTGAHISYYASRQTAGYSQSRFVVENGVRKENPVSIDGDFMVSVGGLMGTAMATQYIERVALQNIYVHGLRYSGGLIGLNPAAGSFTYFNSTLNGETLRSYEIKVHGASTCGGMIGKNQNAAISIDNGKASYSITEIISECTTRDGGTESDYNYGVGGFIGACRTQNQPISIQNIVVGDPNQDAPSAIKASEASIFTGGMIGIVNKGTTTIQNCTVNNQSVIGTSQSGGLIGYWASAQGANTVENVTIYAKNYKKDNPSATNPQISGGDHAGGFLGAGKNDMQKVTITNSSVEGYTITSGNHAGGAVGYWSQSTLALNNVKISENIITATAINTYAGGLVGQLASKDSASLYGYNILVKNLDISGKNGAGSICGQTSSASQAIKLTGFSRQDDREGNANKMIAALVGKPKTAYQFGTNGYVIFADYNDKASTNHSVYFTNMLLHSEISSVSQNLIPETVSDGSVETKTKYTVKGDDPTSLSVSISDDDISEGPTPTHNDETISNPGTTYSGKIIKYDVEPDNATAVSDFATTRANAGFYIYLDDHTQKEKINNKDVEVRKFDGPHYMTSNYNIGEHGLNLSKNKTEAAIWYREAHPTDSNKYRFWTYVNESGTNIKKYIHSVDDGDKNIELSETLSSYFTVTELKTSGEYTNPWDNQTYNDDLSDTFSLYFNNKSVNNNSRTGYLQYSNGGGCIRLYKSAPDNSIGKTNYAFRFQFVQKPAKSIQVLDYDTVTNADGTVTFGANPDRIRTGENVIQEEIDAYAEAFTTGETLDYTKALYIVTKTEKENVDKYGENPSPYVTTSPKRFLDSKHFLAGDGISNLVSYEDSNFYTIYSASVAKTDIDNKRYTIFKRYGDGAVTDMSLTEEDMDEIMAHYSSSSNAFNNNSLVRDFPLLVVDDVNTANTTRLINNYLNVLANTKYNYADTRNNAIYNVKFYKFRLDNDPASDTYKQFVYSSAGKPCLAKGTENIGGSTKYVFKMSADNVDAGAVPQFTLMDVEFYDPSDTSVSKKVAYRLTVPVFVNQVLRFEFKTSVASNTDYYPAAYDAGTKFMFENLGNPVTVEFEYAYRRTPSEWAEIINGGSSVLDNYYKTLNLNTHSKGWPTDARLVLVDASNRDKYYYLDTPNTTCLTYIDLYDFVEKDGTTHFSPAPLQNLMDLKAVTVSDGNLIATEDNTSESATVCVEGTYYRPIAEGETGTTRVVLKASVTQTANDSEGELVRISGSDYSSATVYDGTYYYRPATDADTSVVKYSQVTVDKIISNASVTEIPNGASGDLVRVSGSDSNALVYDGTYYYRVATAEEKADTDIVKYNVATVTVSTKANLVINTTEGYPNSKYYDGTNYYREATNEEKANALIQKYTAADSGCDSERYYLSVFTKEDSNDTKIYDLELQTRDTFERNSIAAKTATGIDDWEVDNWQPNKIYGSNTSVHIIMGNLYDNELSLNVTPMTSQTATPKAKPQLMAEDNYYLTVQMQSTVKLRSTAVGAGVNDNMSNHPESTIYQTFLMTYDKLEEVGGQSTLGIEPLASAFIGNKSYYIKAGTRATFSTDSATNITDQADFLMDSSSYIELRNNQNLVSYLADSTHSYAATLQVEYEMAYVTKYLSYQFPKRQNEGDDVGAKVIGYSNISSSQIGAAYSAASISKEDTQKIVDGQSVENGRRYYTDDDTKAILNYEVVPTEKTEDVKNPNSNVYGGDYSYLGINAFEFASNNTTSFIDSYLIYDIRDIQNPGEYIELTMSLSRSGSYLKPAVGSPQGHGSALNLTEYLTNIKIYGKDIEGAETMDILYDMNQDTLVNNKGTGNTRAGQLIAALNEDGNMLTIRVHKSLLRTQGSSDSNIYMIPISYEVKTGNDLFKNNPDGKTYSNYKVSITAATYSLLTASSSDYTQASYAYDHLIYTNTRVNSNVIE